MAAAHLATALLSAWPLRGCVRDCVPRARHSLTHAVTLALSPWAWDKWSCEEESSEEESERAEEESAEEESDEAESAEIAMSAKGAHTPAQRQHAQQQRALRLWTRNAAKHCRMVGMALIGLHLGDPPHTHNARLPMQVVMLIARMSIATPCPVP